MASTFKTYLIARILSDCDTPLSISSIANKRRKFSFRTRIMTIKILILILFTINIFSPIFCDEKLIDSIISSSKYDKRSEPDSLTIVLISVNVDTVREVDDKDQSFTVQITLQQEWNDTRLRYDERSIDGNYTILTDSSKIWTPDTYFIDQIEADSGTMKPIEIISITPGGQVKYSKKLVLKLFCSMDLSKFPFDTQSCGIKFSSRK